MNYSILIYLMLLMLYGCNGFTHHEKIINDKYLIATEGLENMNISVALNDGSYIGIVHSCVYAIGYNNKFIIAKQHPYEFGKPLNKDVTNYYIIPVQGKGTYAEQVGVIGPMTLKQFNEKRARLGVSKDLMFTKVFKDLE